MVKKFDQMALLHEALKNQLSTVPVEKINERKKINRYMQQIDFVNEKVALLTSSKLKMIEERLGLKFETLELFTLVFFQPSAGALFNELKVHFNRDGMSQYLNVLDELGKLPDAMKVLAFIGDAVISLALVEILWNPNISQVGELTNKRSAFASNSNLAKLCDNLGLYESRIHFDPESQEPVNKVKVNHEKGTLVEGLFGVMYLQSGLSQVVKTISLLKQ